MFMYNAVTMQDQVAKRLIKRSEYLIVNAIFYICLTSTTSIFFDKILIESEIVEALPASKLASHSSSNNMVLLIVNALC